MEYADHTGRSTPEYMDTDDDIAESDGDAVSQSEDNEAGDGSEPSDSDESADEDVVSVGNQQPAVQDAHASSPTSPLNHSHQLQLDLAPPQPIPPMTENFMEERPSTADNPLTMDPEPEESAQVGHSMRIQKARRVLTSSCECGQDVEERDRREDSQVAVQCVAKGCETVWVCISVCNTSRLICFSHHQYHRECMKGDLLARNWSCPSCRLNNSKRRRH